MRLGTFHCSLRAGKNLPQPLLGKEGSRKRHYLCGKGTRISELGGTVWRSQTVVVRGFHGLPVTSLTTHQHTQGGITNVGDHCRRRSFSLVEAAVSTLIVGVLLSAVLNTIGAVSLGQVKTAERRIGNLLTRDLMAEILLQRYLEPVDPPVFGRETSESGGMRGSYDDVDDYNGWISSPLEYRDGTLIPNRNTWTRKVVVVWVDPNDLTLVSLVDLGVKRITVQAIHNNITVSTLVAVRTGSWEPQVVLQRK